MAAIDYAICSVNDVIAHSLRLHPQLLADRLRFHARVHAQFADAYGDREVTRNELDFADRLHSFAGAIDIGEYTISDDVEVRREAFSRAAGLQNMHPIMQKVIVEREDARSARPAEAVEVPLAMASRGHQQPSTERFCGGVSPGAKRPSSCNTTSRSQLCAVS